MKLSAEQNRKPTAMDEITALSRMVAPGDTREGIWRKGVLQIWLTRNCDKACFGCTQNSQLRGAATRMTVYQFEQAVKSLRGYFGVVGIFGGNPATHKEFDKICDILRVYVPFEQRGLWCNNPMGKGDIMAKTFNPAVSNLNVHLDQAAYDEFARDWPACKPFLKGLDSDSRHGPPYVAMQDLDVLPRSLFKDDDELAGAVTDQAVENNEENRWTLISRCDINKYWSSMICVVRGELRAFFCEIAAAQAILHQDNPDWNGTGAPMPDLGLPVVPGWWKQPMADFAAQARTLCHSCGIPLKGFGALATTGPTEQVSKTHASVFKPKRVDRPVELVQLSSQLGEGHLPKSTDYIENGSL